MVDPQITLAQCQPLRSNPGFALRPDAADAWDRACTTFGATVLLTGTWRSYETQERLFRERYSPGNLAGMPGYTSDVRNWNGRPWTRRAGTNAAAVPGTSTHGAGLAVDVKTARSAGDPPHPQAVVFTGFSDPDRTRFLQVAEPHGWDDDEGRSVGEYWHLTYYADRDRHSSGPVDPTLESEDDMILLHNNETGAVIFVCGGVGLGVLGSDYAAFQAAGVKVAHLTNAQFNAAQTRFGA